MNTPPLNPPGAAKRARWRPILIWLGVGFLVLNLLPFVWGIVSGTLTHPVFIFATAVALLLSISVPFGGINLMRTAFNPATADFTRRDDTARGGYVYDVRPARASWLAVLVPLPLCALLAIWGVYATWMLYAATALYLFVVGVFVLPGARERQPVTIAVSPDGLHSADLSVPLERIADLAIELRGVKVSEDPLMPGPNGVPTSSMVGRGLGRRQAARSLALTLRADGESQARVIAGGLTQACAQNLLHDIEQAMGRFGAAQTAAR